MLSSGVLHHVALIRTDVLEEGIASIIRVTRIQEVGTLAATASQSMPQRNTMSKTQVLMTATQSNIPEDSIHHFAPCSSVVVTSDVYPSPLGYELGLLLLGYDIPNSAWFQHSGGKPHTNNDILHFFMMFLKTGLSNQHLAMSQ
jgi:hypothetical protein